jgi:hypothetical protein
MRTARALPRLASMVFALDQDTLRLLLLADAFVAVDRMWSEVYGSRLM